MVVVAIERQGVPKANQSASGKHHNGHQRCDNITRRRMLGTRTGVNFITACRRSASQPVAALSKQPDDISSYRDEQTGEVLPRASPRPARCASACGLWGEMYEEMWPGVCPSR